METELTLSGTNTLGCSFTMGLSQGMCSNFKGQTETSENCPSGNQKHVSKTQLPRGDFSFFIPHYDEIYLNK